LQDELAGTENRISVERKRYNDTLQDYNTYVSAVPGEHVTRASQASSRTTRTSKRQKDREKLPKVNFGTTPTTQTPATQAPATPAPATAPAH
jgi:LemA protein